MKILIIGGMHGNEPLGQQVVGLFKKQPFAGIDTLLANKKAIAQNVRFIQADLNRSFPGNINSKVYEQQRAAQIVNKCKSYDVVLDFHNTHCPSNDCSFIGETANQDLPDISSFLSLERVIIADYDCLNKYAPNCISIEISLSSPAMDALWWYHKIIELSQAKISKEVTVQKYRFVYRMTLEDRDNLKLQSANLQAFKPIDPNLAQSLGLTGPLYPIFIDDIYTPYNYGGLLNKINV